MDLAIRSQSYTRKTEPMIEQVKLGKVLSLVSVLCNDFPNLDPDSPRGVRLR